MDTNDTFNFALLHIAKIPASDHSSVYFRVNDPPLLTQGNVSRHKPDLERIASERRGSENKRLFCMDKAAGSGRRVQIEASQPLDHYPGIIIRTLLTQQRFKDLYWVLIPTSGSPVVRAIVGRARYTRRFNGQAANASPATNKKPPCRDGLVAKVLVSERLGHVPDTSTAAIRNCLDPKASSSRPRVLCLIVFRLPNPTIELVGVGFVAHMVYDGKV
ncbi:hypothetical protein EDD15DRAFT_2198638 [Pisolithus albus]|nr:hypothetical protein EDD15DRAFT_2198638 [Pisolithus albus]